MRTLWTEQGFVAYPDPESGPVAVESFLVDEGRVRAPGRHLRRLVGTCRSLSLDLSEHRLAGFVDAALQVLPGTGRWFPRLEVYPGGPAALVLWIRPAPDPEPTARIWCGPPGDPRRLPSGKGPDLVVLGRLRSRAVALGADDALLRDGSGLVLETANHGLVWWDGADLCLVEPELPRLPSVTVELIAEHVRAAGVRVRTRRAVLANLLGAEVWAVNALHGIRVVDRWLFEDRSAWWGPAPDRARLGDVRAALDALTVVPRMQLTGNH